MDNAEDQEMVNALSPDGRRSQARAGRRRVGRQTRNGNRLSRNDNSQQRPSAPLLANYSSDEGQDAEVQRQGEGFQEIDSQFESEGELSGTSDSDASVEE